jgi:hypothetical protein
MRASQCCASSSMITPLKSKRMPEVIEEGITGSEVRSKK